MPLPGTQQTVVQVGPESTNGTIVAATKQLTLVELEVGPELEFKLFPGMGRRFMAASGLNKDMTAGKLGGVANYTEEVYWATMLWGNVSPTTPVGATLGRKWLWTPSLSAAITHKSFSFEVGNAIKAQKFGFGLLTDFGLKLNRDDQQIEGALIGQALVDNITLTGALPIILPQPALGAHLAVYADTTFGGLGVTKLTSAWDMSWKYSKGQEDRWPIDRLLTSFGDVVDLDPTVEFYCKVSADAQGQTLLAAARANTTQYVRVESIGPQIETGSPNQFWTRTIDMACRITKAEKYTDEKGVRAIGFTFTAIEDASLGGGFTYWLENTQTAL